MIPQFLFLGTALLIESPLTAYCFFLIDRFSRKKKQTALKSDALNALRYSSLYSVVTDWTAAALLIFSFVFKSRYSENISNISGMFLHYHCLAYVIQFHFVLLGAFGKSAIVKTQSSKRNANASQKRERIPSIPTPAPFQRNNISAQMQRNNTQDMDLEAAPTQDAKDVATAPMQETRNIHDISTQEIQTQAAPTQNIHDISTEKMQSQAAAPTDIVVRSGTNQSNPGKSDPIL